MIITFSCDDCGLTQSDILSVHECVEFYEEQKKYNSIQHFYLEEENTIIYCNK